MVILSKNPYEVPASELNTIKVEQTILGGKPYTNQHQSFIKAIFKGMFSKRKI